MLGGFVQGAVTGTETSGVWAGFTAADPTAEAEDYLAVIDWGDGSSGTLGQVLGAGGYFAVGGSHTYATAGDYTVTVSVTDIDDVEYSATGTTHVGDVFAGALTTLTVTSLAVGSTSGYSATVDWGEGSALDSGTTLSIVNGNLTVVGQHTYAVDSLDEPGAAYQATVTISGPSGLNITGTRAVKVERPPMAGVGEDVTTDANGVLSNVELGRFTVPNVTDTAGEFEATVHWGDGTTSSGTVTGSDGVFRVLGSHTYSNGGDYAVQVEVKQHWSTAALSLAFQALATAVPNQAGGTTIQGTITYDAGKPKPVRGAQVKVFSIGFLGSLRLAGETYTDDQGHPSLTLPNNSYSGLTVHVFSRTRPAGTGADEIPRAVEVRWSNTVEFSPQAAGPYSGSVTVDGLIASGTTQAKAFWVYDAAITASRFHAGLPGVEARRTNIDFPSVGPGSYTLGGKPHIKDRDFDSWDTIIHEYGHVVQQDGGFFPFSLTGYGTGQAPMTHDPEINLRFDPKYTSTWTPWPWPWKTLTQLAFSEGFANWYSMRAQKVQGVSSPAVTGGDGSMAGDDALYGYDREIGEPLQKVKGSGIGFSGGEDEELTVMRILWDLFDADNAKDLIIGGTLPKDNLQLDYADLYAYIAKFKVTTLEEFWNRLDTLASVYYKKNPSAMLGKGLNPNYVKFRLDVGAILQLNNVSPRPDKLQSGGQTVTIWSGGDPIPEFVWEIPTGSGGTQTLNHFEVRIFTDGYHQLFSKVVSPTITGNQATWRPSQADWENMTVSRGKLLWVVGGAYRPAGDKPPQSGPTYGNYFWSDASTFTVRA